MSAPIAVTGPPVELASGPKPSTPITDHQDGSVEPFLAMLTGALAGASSSPAADRPPMLDLLHDGEWTFELPTSDGSKVSDGGSEALSLEKGLDDWAASIGRQDRAPGPILRPGRGDQAKPPGAADAATGDGLIPLGISMNPIGAGSIAAITTWLRQAVTDAADQLGELGDAKTGKPAVAPKPVGGPTTQPQVDLPTAPVPAAKPPVVEGPTSVSHTVEFGGFTFPTEPDRLAPRVEVTGHPSGVTPVSDRPTEPSPVTRPIALPLGAGQGPFDGGDRSAGGRDSNRSNDSGGRRPAPQPIDPTAVRDAGNRLADLLLRAGRDAAGSNRTEGPKEKELNDAKPVHPSTEPSPTAAHPTGTDQPVGPGKPFDTAPTTTAPKAGTLDAEIPVTPKRPDTVTVELKDESGDHGKLRLSMTGTTVKATILPNDSALADRLTAGIRELRQSLEDHGFAEPRLTVQAPKADGPAVATQPFGRTVIAEPQVNGSRDGSRAGTDEQPRDRWQGQSERQQRDQRTPQRQPRRQNQEGWYE